MAGKTMAAATLALLTFAATACGGDKESPPRASAPPAYTVTPKEEAGNKFSFDIPASLKGGVVTFTMNNTGKESHDFQLAKTVAGHTLDELLKQVSSEDAPLEAWVAAAGGVGGVAPGKTGRATVDLEPGKYWFFCTESSGEGDASVSHATAGMAGELTLTSDSGATFPAAASSVKAADYSFTSTGLVAGENAVRFSNDGQQLHHLIAAPIAAGKTIEDVKTAIASENPPEGEPPIDFEQASSTAVINPGQTEIIYLDLKAATTYAFICFMPDKGTAGPPHAAKGMVAEAKIG